jgi:hypothetical protein
MASYFREDPNDKDAYIIDKEKENILILRTKIYEFIKYIHPFLNKYPTNERFALESYIRNTLYNILFESIKYEKSKSVSHLYSIDNNLVMLKEYFKLSKDLGVKAINKDRIQVITRYLDEIGRICGGLIKYKDNNKKKKDSKTNETKMICPFYYDNKKGKENPISFGKPTKQ